MVAKRPRVALSPAYGDPMHHNGPSGPRAVLTATQLHQASATTTQSTQTLSAQPARADLGSVSMALPNAGRAHTDALSRPAATARVAQPAQLRRLCRHPRPCPTTASSASPPKAPCRLVRRDGGQQCAANSGVTAALLPAARRRRPCATSPSRNRRRDHPLTVSGRYYSTHKASRVGTARRATVAAARLLC